jgi:phosphoribosylamine--glycine ligase
LRVLVVGSGGREHALSWKLAQEAEVHVAPGNPGIAQVAQVHAVAALDLDGLLSLARRIHPDLTVVGPEDPLIAGLGDRLRAEGFAVCGPGANGAALEGSKAFSKALMREAGVRTAQFEAFRESGPAIAFARDRVAAVGGVAVKASGAALGKGVVVAGSAEEAEEAIRAMLDRRVLGEAGAEIVVEDRLIGREFSLLTLCNETGFHSLPVAQDHKRIFDGDRGPNTGGMGAYSPVPWVTDALVHEAEESAVRPILRILKNRGIDYRGVLFTGFLLQDGKPYCLEYNVRLGDPETQAVLPRLGAGLAEALRAVALGLPIPPVPVRPEAAVAVVLASEGYPGTVRKGVPIEMGDTGDCLVFHAGTSSLNGTLVTSGGRVLAVVALGDDVPSAREAAYRGVAAIRFEGMQFRTDIGARLNESG